MSRFDALAAKLAAHGARDPKALAAHIGRKKYGKAAMAAMAKAGKKKASANANSKQGPREFFRDVPFEMTGGDDLTFEGYAAVWNTPTRINSSWEGEFDEQILPGAFERSLTQKMPVLMFEHGKHPLIGSMPLGVITEARSDDNGLFVSARLSDNWLIEPVRDAVRDGAVTGMSFRFFVPDGGDTWQKRAGDVPLRNLVDVDVAELGPVVFPAYEPTTATVRSALDHLPDLTGRPGAWSAGGGDDAAQAAQLTQLRSRDRLLRLKGIV